jgi:glycerol-3-phosphate O-acyltransferase
MSTTVSLPLWLFVLILLFAGASFVSHFLFPSVRWFFRRRMEKAVARLNQRLETPIQPFKLLRRYDLIQRLLYDPDVTRAIVEHAAQEGLREDVAFEQARRYAREIVPSFSAFTYFGWGVRLARLVSNALFWVRLGHQDARAMARIDPKATLIFVMNHRSNMDYVLVTHLAADRSALSYAVGEWANVWPLSRLIRAMGAYFIQRKSRGGLYRRVLRTYVRMATQNGVTQAIFLEGGLSLTGGLAPAKLGLLSYIVDDFDPAHRDVVFVPVGLNYDRVLEDRVLMAAAHKSERRFDAGLGHVARAILWQLWLAVTGRYRRFGHASVSFGPPLSLRGHPELVRDADALAESLMARIAAVVPVLPVPLVAHVLQQADAQDRAALETGSVEALDRLEDAEGFLSGERLNDVVEEGLQALIRRGIVTEREDRLHINDPEALAFYARSIAHLL